MIIDVIKIFIPTATAFFIGIAITPFVSHYLYKHKMWKKKPGNLVGLGGGGTPIFNKLHKERDTGTPRMGGIIIWASVLVTVFFFWLLAQVSGSEFWKEMDFLSRGQTWLPLFTLIVASFVGLVDDVFQIKGKGNYLAGGLSLKMRISLVVLIALIGAWWFFVKLGVSGIMVPFYGELELGLMFIPLFVITMVALFSGGVIDGIDGLSGGVMVSIFSAYALIAFFQNQIDLAVFSAVVAGGTLAFLWFNIPPARFYMTETGILGLTATLTVVAFLTKAVVVLPIIALPLLVAPASSLIQVLSKRFRNGKKVFLVAPIHHHFEALGWPSYKVTMRFWIISVIFAMIGVVIALIG